MFTGQILCGNRDTGILDIGSMPKDFVLSARKLVVMEEYEYAELAEAGKKPEPGEFTKEIKELGDYLCMEHNDNHGQSVCERACGIIDRLNFSCDKHRDKKPEKVCYWCLRDVNFSYQMEVQEQKEEIERLTAENAKYIKALEGCSTCKDQYEAEVVKLEAGLKAKNKRIKGIQEYIRKNSGHHPSCGSLHGSIYACVCGFNEALKEKV